MKIKSIEQEKYEVRARSSYVICKVLDAGMHCELHRYQAHSVERSLYRALGIVEMVQKHLDVELHFFSVMSVTLI
jgi:hypothetical protein